ncbi:Mu transposase C-terminal domain-containing protein [Leifsonia shinshuensis]|uniref:Transposase n=1 Tax=Leifsonia shinshuensis TaxID=150026 RepID=A0A7G6YAA6_9MICO|nr:Mu transposase C-terminal domain-containing protein [Leifsonia shinshuensis]QNE35421.1 transposase [Leifsonia shinshuensis]
MRHLDPNATLRLTDGDFTITEIAGSMYTLRNINTGEYRNIHISDIVPRLTEPAPRVASDPRQLENIPDDDRDELLFWGGHLNEMNTGRKDLSETDAPVNPNYDPGTVKLEQRVERKSEELTALGRKVSPSTLYRKRKKYLDGGLAALIDNRSIRTESPLDKADERWVAALRQVIAEAANESTRTAAGLLAIARRRLKEQYPGQVIAVGSRATQYRQFNYIANGKYTTGTSKRRQERIATPRRPFGDTRKYAPGQVVEIDSTTLDAPVLDEEGNVQRPILTIMVDVCTGSIVAHSFRLVAATSMDHAFLLAQAMTPRRLRPGANQAWRMMARRFPWAELVSFEERNKLDEQRPFIVPAAITVDHGTDYTGTTFESACAKFGVDLLYAAPATGTDKPHVERAFRTIKDGFVQYIAAFTGGSPDNRGRMDGKYPLLDLITLDLLFDEWVARVYQNRPSDSLIDPFHPSVSLSPNEMYAACFNLKGKPPVPIDTIDYIELLPTYERTVTANGIQYNNRFYDSLGLHKLRIAPKKVDVNGRPDNKVEFRANPYDVRAIWVRDPDGGWIEAIWRHDGVTSEPHSTAIAAEARRIVAASDTRRDDHYYEDLTLEILSQTDASITAQSKARTRAAAALKLAEAAGTPFHTPALTAAAPTAADPATPDDLNPDEVPYFEGEEL